MLFKLTVDVDVIANSSSLAFDRVAISLAVLPAAPESNRAGLFQWSGVVPRERVRSNAAGSFLPRPLHAAPPEVETAATREVGSGEAVVVHVVPLGEISPSPDLAVLQLLMANMSAVRS